MTDLVYNIAKTVGITLPSCASAPKELEYLNTYRDFGQHVDSGTRRLYELCQNTHDQFRIQARIQDCPDQDLRVRQTSWHC